MLSGRNIAIGGGAVALLGVAGLAIMRRRRSDDDGMADVPLVDEGLFDDVQDMGSLDATSSPEGQANLFGADTRVDTPIPSLGGGGLGGGGGGGSPDVERRLADLEAQLAEANQSRERLESQVAAQTEELRVQRAAIARTQRAVRNLNRPEEEDAPTEPALRDPQRPGGTRV